MSPMVWMSGYLLHDIHNQSGLLHTLEQKTKLVTWTKVVQASQLCKPTQQLSDVHA